MRLKRTLSDELFKCIVSCDMSYLKESDDKYIYRYSDEKIVFIIYLDKSVENVTDLSSCNLRINVMQSDGSDKDYYGSDIDRYKRYKIVERLLYVKENHLTLRRKKKLNEIE
jgi:tRNA(Phe) wybutosine-synthesizing methylase Tyw3